MSEPIKVLPMAQLLRLAREKEERERGQSPASSRSHTDWQPDTDWQSHTGWQSENGGGGGRGDWQPDTDWQPHTDHQPVDLMASLPKVAGHLKIPNAIADHLLSQLTADEQAVFLQLFRLSRGYGKSSCSISNRRLSERSNVKMTSMKAAIKRLEGRGLISKKATTLGYGKEQGVEYWVSHPDSQPDSDWQSDTGCQPNMSPIKEKLLKENLKRDLPPADTKNCPDCQGSGFWYPEGVEKGVARCKHERMGK